MRRFLLDTNVLSERSRRTPNKNVITFLSHGEPSCISAITLHELKRGAELMPDLARSEILNEWVAGIRNDFETDILPVTADIAELAAILRATASKEGRALQIEDALIAATAIEYDLTLATRNVRDFEMTGVDLINPWQSVN